MGHNTAARGEGAGAPRAARGQPATAFTPQQLAFIKERARALGYRTHAELARAVRVSSQTVGRWYRQRRGAHPITLERLAVVLEVPLGVLQRADPAQADWTAAPAAAGGGAMPGTSGTGAAGGGSIRRAAGTGSAVQSNVYPGVLELSRLGEVGWPIYDAAGAGDPVAADESSRPIPVDHKLLEGEAARVVGPHGFGVRVQGESLSRWAIHDGDVVWINPDKAPRLNWPNLYRCRRALEGDHALLVKLWRRDGEREWLEGDSWTDGPGAVVDLADVEPIGPVLRHTPRERVPSREPDPAAARAATPPAPIVSLPRPAAPGTDQERTGTATGTDAASAS